MNRTRPLILILAVYLVLGALFALFTPAWQAPDEPAHFNYVRHLVDTARLPVLQAGDYDQAYLEAIKGQRFPADMPIDGIRYEGHQPPLFYVLAAPVYLAAAASNLARQVVALRLLGVILGGGVIAFVWASARRLFPGHPGRATLAAGFVAFLPMHIAMMASINNDTLAELLIAATMFRLLGHLRSPQDSPRSWLITGLLVGLGLLTKAQAYILLPLTGGVWLWQVWRRQRQQESGMAVWRSGAAWLAPTLFLPLFWWLRNLSVYGITDPLGLQRHDAIVTGQPRTLAWIGEHGLAGYLDRLVDFTFQSFWGVFGWLGVFMDGRVYGLLASLSLLVVVGLMWQAWRWRRGQITPSPFQKRGLILLAAQLALVVLAYIWYNLDFVQHQGRYLFPALLPISLGFALGAEGLFAYRRGSLWGAIVAAVVTAGLVIAGLLAGDVNGWAILLAGAAVVALGLNSRLGLSMRFWTTAVLGLFVLIDLLALFGAIVPQLG